MKLKNLKKHAKVLNFVLLAIVSFSFCLASVYADEYNGTGTHSIGCKGQKNCECNQSNTQLCIWDISNHVILKVSLYYFPSKTGLSGGEEIGNLLYANGNIDYYKSKGFFSGKTIYPLPTDVFPTSTRGGISGPAEAFFYNDKDNFRKVFTRITDVSLAEDKRDDDDDQLQEYMLKYCSTRGYGNTLKECHQTIGGSKGFRIVIQPIITGIYGSDDKIRLGTVKEIFKNYNIWNSDSTKLAASTAMYLDRLDLGFSTGVSSPLQSSSEISKTSSAYGLNMFTWPVKIEDKACNPAVDGVKVCCDKHSVKYETDANNHDITKITKPMTQAQLNSAECNNVCDPKVDGVRKCCKKNNIKDATDAANHDKTKVTSPMTQKQLNEAGCNDTCDPAVDGVKVCCSAYSIKYASDPANYDLTKIATPMTQSQLDAAGCNPDIACSTTYKMTTSVPSTCQNSISGLVSDSASWECVFKSTLPANDSTVKNNYAFTSFSNRYCSVYCKEQIEYTLPGNGAYADAGTYFVVTMHSGYQKIGPITYKGTSTCRVTDERNSENGIIDVAQFVADFNSANYSVLAAYDRWQYAELQNEVINDGTSHYWGSTCSDSWCVDWDTREICTTVKKVKSCYNYTYCSDYDHCSEYRSGSYWTYNNKYYYGSTFSSSTGISNGGCGCNSRCGSSCTPKVSLKDTASLRSAYISAVNYRTSLLEELKKCNNFYKTYREFKPTLTFAYDDVLYKKTYTLKATGSASSYTDYLASGSSKGSKNSSVMSYGNSVSSDASYESSSYNTNSTSVRGYANLINYYDCGYSVTKTGCTAINQYVYPTNAWYEQVTTRTYTYTLPDGINNYVDKPSGFSSSTPTSNYDYIPFSNLPIHFSTKPGNYNYTITTTSYGPGNKFNSYIIGNTNFNGRSYHANSAYNCTYRIDCNKTIICGANSCDNSCDRGDNDNTGTDLIFRPISLYYPFPGQSATTTNQRNAGYNWSVASGSDAINKFIYNNRGVSYYDLYKLQPMYEITLTPALMRKIKAYNDTQNSTRAWYYRGTAKEMYTTVGYSDFSLACKNNSDGSKSSNCTSSIIRSWGVRGCAISGSGYYRCGNTVAW